MQKLGRFQRQQRTNRTAALWTKGQQPVRQHSGLSRHRIGLRGSGSVVCSEPAVFLSQLLDLLHQGLVDGVFLNQTVDLCLEQNRSNTCSTNDTVKHASHRHQESFRNTSSDQSNYMD